ncbi:hypothetical protein GP486_006859 [Trichoglossum hirsutum]|uniref:RNA helicase n=1 Tax=Trichoglossum hirsutum TaxID=265104 RepID=A0A9P8L3B1_9PEZI|nr:hypothetical protein GP486_006859 [Trichoglossum hirsutum]
MAEPTPIFVRPTYKPLKIINPHTRSPVEGFSPVLTPPTQAQPIYKRNSKTTRPPRTAEDGTVAVAATASPSPMPVSSSVISSTSTPPTPGVNGVNGSTAEPMQNQQINQRTQAMQTFGPPAGLQLQQPQQKWGQPSPFPFGSRPMDVRLVSGLAPINSAVQQEQLSASSAPAHHSTNGAYRYPAAQPVTAVQPISSPTISLDSRLAGHLNTIGKPDVYARAFVPETWSAINHAPAQIIPSKPMSDIAYQLYISKFAGSSFLTPLPSPAPPIPPSSLPPLTPQSYIPYFMHLLLQEQTAQNAENKTYGLHLTSFNPIDHNTPLFSVSVPGLREDAPRVLLGDTVLVRQVRLDMTGEPWGMRAWLCPGGGRERGLPAPGFTGFEHRAVVWAVDRKGEKLVLRVDGLVDDHQLVFNVNFEIQQGRTFERWWRAVGDVGEVLREGGSPRANGHIEAAKRCVPSYHFLGTVDAGSGGQSQAVDEEWMRRMLFPDEGDGIVQIGLPQGVSGGRLFDQGLNYEQKLYPPPSYGLVIRISTLSSLTSLIYLFPFATFLRPSSRKPLPTCFYFLPKEQSIAILSIRRIEQVTTSRLAYTAVTRLSFSVLLFPFVQLTSLVQKSVYSIRRQDYGSIPFLISGPPGTGKTKTIAEIALQLVHNPSLLHTHILLCAPSDPAADILVRRLKEHITQPHLLRLNAASRSFAEVPIDLISYCYTDPETNLFILPEFKKLMSYRIVVTTCRDAGILVQARVTNRDLVRLEKGILDSLHSGGQDNLGSFLHWTALLVDEAAQAMEPDVAIPLTVVAPPINGGIGEVIVVMAGDQNQLGPRTSSRDKNLERSLFERLFDRPIYRDHPLSRKRAKAQDWNPSARTAVPMIHPPFANLFRNYRSHPAILAVPSALFYNDTLIPEATDTDNMIDWTGWRGRGWPVLFSSNYGDDEIEYDGGGWYNVSEAKKACDYALSLVQSNLITQRDICIMSPFSAQVKLLRQVIRREPYELGGVNIGPMEAYQGLESRVAIVCTTRTRGRFLVEDRAKGLGMIDEARRFNVAMTRAKQGLITIGNPWILAQDSAWLALMAFCRRHGLWEEDLTVPAAEGSVWMPGEEVGEGISSLERGLVLREEQEERFPGTDERVYAAGDEDGMWMAGVAAQDAFSDEY